MLDLGEYFAGWQYAMNEPTWTGLTVDGHVDVVRSHDILEH